MTYLCYRNWEKGILPSVTHNLPAGERIVIEAFIRFEDEQRTAVVRNAEEERIIYPST